MKVRSGSRGPLDGGLRASILSRLPLPKWIGEFCGLA